MAAMVSSISEIIHIFVNGAIQLFPLAIALVALEYCAGVHRRNYRARSVRVDLGYVLLSMFYAPLARHFGTLIVGVVLVDSGELGSYPSWFSTLPILLQIIIILIARDCLIYLRHRAFHGRSLWKFHAIHHSSKEVNWLSTARFHPLEALIEVCINLLLLAALAPHSHALVISALLMGLYDYYIHSDLPIRYGLLGYVLVSPVFHRWHHSIEREAHDKNFAAMFSFLDVIGGSFFMPKDRYPEHTGITARDDDVPDSLVKQILYPFFTDHALSKRTRESGELIN